MRKIELQEYKLMPVTEAYEKLKEGNKVYFLDQNKASVKVTSITIVNYTGKIYDVPSDIVLVKRGEAADKQVKSQENWFCFFKYRAKKTKGRKT